MPAGERSASRDARPLAVVTGGALRVGRAICLEFARAGCDVHFTYRSSADAARSLIAELKSLGATGEASELELDDLAAVERLGTLVSGGRVDVLVHNASIYGPTEYGAGTLDPARLREEIMRYYRVNAAAPMVLSLACAARLTASPLPGGGAIVAMCDIHAMGRPRRGFLPYSASKAALAEMVQTLAVDLAPRIRVNGVAPGVVAFPESGYESDDGMQARYLSRVPLGRSGTPQDAAGTVRWLALEAAYVTGQIVKLDGGRSLT